MQSPESSDNDEFDQLLHEALKDPFIKKLHQMDEDKQKLQRSKKVKRLNNGLKTNFKPKNDFRGNNKLIFKRIQQRVLEIQMASNLRLKKTTNPLNFPQSSVSKKLPLFSDSITIIKKDRRDEVHDVWSYRPESHLFQPKGKIKCDFQQRKMENPEIAKTDVFSRQVRNKSIKRDFYARKRDVYAAWNPFNHYQRTFSNDRWRMSTEDPFSPENTFDPDLKARNSQDSFEESLPYVNTKKRNKRTFLEDMDVIAIDSPLSESVSQSKSYASSNSSSQNSFEDSHLHSRKRIKQTTSEDMELTAPVKNPLSKPISQRRESYASCASSESKFDELLSFVNTRKRNNKTSLSDMDLTPPIKGNILFENPASEPVSQNRESCAPNNAGSKSILRQQSKDTPKIISIVNLASIKKTTYTNALLKQVRQQRAFLSNDSQINFETSTTRDIIDREKLGSLKNVSLPVSSKEIIDKKSGYFLSSKSTLLEADLKRTRQDADEVRKSLDDITNLKRSKINARIRKNFRRKLNFEDQDIGSEIRTLPPTIGFAISHNKRKMQETE